MGSKIMPIIYFKTKDLSFNVLEGVELLQAKKQNPDMPLKFGCTRGNCGVCAIRVLSGKGNLTKMCPKEESTLRQKGCIPLDYRLACQCALNGNIEIE